MKSPHKHVHDRVFVYAIVWVISFVGSLLALKTLVVPKEAGIVLTVVTALSFALFLYKYYRSIFFMDEVQIKIQMEAVVIAFALGLILLMTLGMLDLVLTLKKENWSYRHFIPLFAVFYFFGLFISKRKYNFEHEEHD